MRIHTDKLTTQDVCREAFKVGVAVEYLGSHGSRKRDHAYEVALSGSSPYAGASTAVGYPYKAATWDEWGLFIAALFKLEPTAIIGHYNGVENFEQITRGERDRYARYFPENDRGRKTHTAPWLDSSARLDASHRAWQAQVLDAAKR